MTFYDRMSFLVHRVAISFRSPGTEPFAGGLSKRYPLTNDINDPARLLHCASGKVHSTHQSKLAPRQIHVSFRLGREGQLLGMSGICKQINIHHEGM